VDEAKPSPVNNARRGSARQSTESAGDSGLPIDDRQRRAMRRAAASLHVAGFFALGPFDRDAPSRPRTGSLMAGG
jgi:hypothetical protein